MDLYEYDRFLQICQLLDANGYNMIPVDTRKTITVTS